ASLAVRQWGPAACWPARAFAIVAAGPIFTGTYSFGLGLLALIATLFALQRGHLWLGLACVALTIGVSPLAFVFLCMALAAHAAAARRVTGRTFAIAAGLAIAAAVEAAVLVLFPSPGTYPFGFWWLMAVLATNALGIALSARARQAPHLLSFFVIYSAATV